ncbi:MAG TPA: UbiA family prenyltransferase [Candidatus Angelobacter sp.]|nr:UbiA family prenyltransferase [Candidatus Angelobacter sp.]
MELSLKHDSSGTAHASPTPTPAVSVAPSPVLCVDLDGTLIRSNLLWECVISLLKKRPLWVFMLPFWLLGGRANLKSQLAQRAQLDVTSLPYRQDVLEFLKERRSAGGRLVLVTAGAEELARRVAEFLGIFDSCFASTRNDNLKGRGKARFLCREFGERAFEYIGDSRADVAVWQCSSIAHFVGKERVAIRAGQSVAIGRVFPVEKATFRTWIAALRGHHWLKNLLLFLPLALAHRFDARSWMMAAAAFGFFGVCASGVYVLNDLLDLHSDRIHPWKRKRPFAAGDVSIPAGLVISSALLLAALPGSFFLSRNFGLVLTGYTFLTIWYSVHLKKVVLLDAFVLSSFYSIRIWAGALITLVPLSNWFVSFALFFFLSLSMAKRYSELVHASDLIEQGHSGRGYVVADRSLLMNLGIASGFSAVVIFTLYVHSPEVLMLYQRPGPLMLLAPTIAYWLSRLWLKASRGELHEDPVVLAMKDPVSYAVAAIGLLVLIASAAKLH